MRPGHNPGELGQSNPSLGGRLSQTSGMRKHGHISSGVVDFDPVDVNSPYESHYRAVRWIGKIHDTYPSLGPAIFTVASVYFLIQVIAAWVFVPSYSLVSNSISDLGETSCGGYGSLCSPRWWLMDYVGFVLLGLVMVVGSALLYHEFTERLPRERRAAMVGFVLIALGGLGSILVGFFPENENRTMHIVGAFLAIGIGNCAILVLGSVLTLPESMRRSMLMFSSLALAACSVSLRTDPLGLAVGPWNGSRHIR